VCTSRAQASRNKAIIQNCALLFIPGRF
jgi:hypothetical protein